MRLIRKGWKVVYWGPNGVYTTTTHRLRWKAYRSAASFKKQGRGDVNVSRR